MKELVNIQGELKAPKDKRNSFGGYNYRSCEGIMEAVKPLLGKYGCTLVVEDDMVMLGNRFYVKATATIKNAEGETERATAFARESEVKKGMDDSQITGAASSYARKYALNGLLCIDDTKDADATNTHGKEAAPKAAAPARAAVPAPAANAAGTVAMPNSALLEEIRAYADVSMLNAKFKQMKDNGTWRAEYAEMFKQVKAEKGWS